MKHFSLHFVLSAALAAAGIGAASAAELTLVAPGGIAARCRT